MNRNIITLAIIATISTAALATKPKPTPATTPAPAAQAEAIAAAVAVAVQKQMQVQAQQQHQNAQAISGGNMVTSSTTVAAQARDPVATAYAGALTASNGTCLGSASGGVQGAAFGVSLGSTKKDEGCDARYDAATLISMGQSRAALARLCQREEIAKAIEASGQQCPTKPGQSAPAVKTAEAYTGDDPIVRARLGLGE